MLLRVRRHPSDTRAAAVAVIFLGLLPLCSPGDAGVIDAMRASLCGAGRTDGASESSDDGLEAPVRRQVTFEELRQGMREEFEQFEEEDLKLRPQHLRPPVRGSRALLVTGFVDGRESRRVCLRAGDPDGLESERGKGKVQDSREDSNKGLLTDELIEAYAARICEQEREEQESRVQEEYVGHFLDRELAQAVYRGNMSAVEELVKCGASVNRWLPEDDDRLQPNALGVAAGVGNTQMAERLIDLGADPNRFNGRGYRALHFAVFSGSVAMCQMLVDRGADLGVVDYSGDQPIDRAEVGGEEFRDVCSWMEKKMRDQKIARVYGNVLLKPHEEEELDRAQDVWDSLTSKTKKPGRKGEDAEERRARHASAQLKQRLKREGVLPADFDEVMRRFWRNHEEDRLWLEKRFLLHLWDDHDAAQQESRRVETTHGRLREEIEKLEQLMVETC